MDSQTVTTTAFSDPSVWNALVQIFILAAALLLGNAVRKFSVMKKSLIPSALIGGVILLLLKLFPTVNSFIDRRFMEVLTYHCLAVGFIAMALRKQGGSRKGMTKSVLEAGVLQGGVYVLQAMVGIGISLILFAACGFFPAGGILLALGFGQGTGQALNYGNIFETTYGFTGGSTFGLTVATVGFFVASIIGVVYMNILRRKGKLRIVSEKEKYVTQSLSDYVGENEVPDIDSVDKSTLNIFLVFFIYGLVYIVMRLIGVNLVWGFNFLFGSIFALVARQILNLMTKKKIMRRDITNNFILNRISGFAFDVMIISGVAAIDLNQLSSMWWQITIICAAGAVVTFAYIRLASKQIFKGYENEGFFAFFGMLTGTASNGMILLREIDPKYETPAASNLVLSGVPAIAFGGGLLIVLGYCPKGWVEALITFGILLVAFVIFSLILFRHAIFKKKK